MSKQEPTITNLPDRRPGESDRDYYRRIEAWINDDARTKTDLQNWTGSLPFHLNREK